jgi:hypothetical protein
MNTVRITKEESSALKSTLSPPFDGGTYMIGCYELDFTMAYFDSKIDFFIDLEGTEYCRSSQVKEYCEAPMKLRQR